jgi:protein-disulfide isomerase
MAKKQPQGDTRSRQQIIDAIAAEVRTRYRISMAVFSVVVAAVLFVFVYLGVTAFNDAMARDKAIKEAGGTDSYFVAYGGNPDAKAQVDIFFDFICPSCGSMERANGKALRELADQGVAYLKYHPINFQDPNSQGTKYSTRAANAFVTISKEDPDPNHLLDFAELMWENQPDEGTPGLDDSRIAELAAEAGVPENVISNFASQKYAGWVDQSNAITLEKETRSTPSVKINGEFFSGGMDKAVGDVYTPNGPLIEAIKNAANA